MYPLLRHVGLIEVKTTIHYRAAIELLSGKCARKVKLHVKMKIKMMERFNKELKERNPKSKRRKYNSAIAC